MLKSIINNIKTKLCRRKSRFNRLRSEIHRSCNNVLLQQRINILNDSMLHSEKRGVTDYSYFDDHQIIVSLTTFELRLSQVYLAIESIMQQTKKANRVVLWLSKELEGKILPQPLINQMARGLEVFYCDDIRSYTKLLPSLKMFPNDAIITIDDDVIYNIYTLESLINSYLEDSSYIYFNRGNRACFDGDKLKKYKEWYGAITEKDVSILNFPTGVGGVLYPPHIFNDEVFNKEVFMRDCKYADDVWFYVMTIYNDRRSRRAKNLTLSSGDDLLLIPATQVVNLHSTNVQEGMNDLQLQSVLNRYELLDKIKAEAGIVAQK